MTVSQGGGGTRADGVFLGGPRYSPANPNDFFRCEDDPHWTAPNPLTYRPVFVVVGWALVFAATIILFIVRGSSDAARESDNRSALLSNF